MPETNSTAEPPTATPLPHPVNLTDVIRNAMRVCHGKSVTSGPRPMKPIVLPATTAEA